MAGQAGLDWSMQIPARHSYQLGVTKAGILIPAGSLINSAGEGLGYATPASTITLYVDPVMYAAENDRTVVNNPFAVIFRQDFQAFELNTMVLPDLSAGYMPLITAPPTPPDLWSDFATDKILQVGMWLPIVINPSHPQSHIGLRLATNAASNDVVVPVLLEFIKTVQG